MLKLTFRNSSILTMFHFLTLSIFLLPMVTASGDEFWDDVDMMENDLSDPEDLPTLATTNEVPPIEPTRETPPHAPSSNTNGKRTLKRIGPLNGKFSQKFITLRASEVEKFKQKLIAVDSQNISFTIVQDKLEALDDVNEWFEIQTYKVENYSIYWGKVCVTFWDKPLVKGHRIACVVSRRYSSFKKLVFQKGERKQYFDLLSCKCHTYIFHCRKNLSTPESFLIHKGKENEFFIFDENESGGTISIKDFKDGITLPNPSDLEVGKKTSATFIQKSVTLGPRDIETFEQAITINESYPQNVSSEEINDILMGLDEVHEWPDLFKYGYENYSRYWAKVCVFFWRKQLNELHHQACIIFPSLGESRVRKLFLQDRTQHFDTLRCKCHSYILSAKEPISIADIFLIHQSSANEFFIFEQRATPSCKHTLFIKDFIGGITLPDPDDFN